MKKNRLIIEQESGYQIEISTPAWLSLAKKAGKSEVPLSVLEQVYARGLLEAHPHPKNTPEQQAFLRVESFLHQGKAYEMDEDLTEMCSVPDGRKHMHIIKNAIKHHEERNKPVNEAGILPSGKLLRGVIAKGIVAAHRKYKTGQWSKKGFIGAITGRESSGHEAERKFQEKKRAYKVGQSLEKKLVNHPELQSKKKPDRRFVPTTQAAQISKDTQSQANADIKRREKESGPSDFIGKAGGNADVARNMWIRSLPGLPKPKYPKTGSRSVAYDTPNTQKNKNSKGNGKLIGSAGGIG